MQQFHENQIKAICHNQGPMLVLAGPGSGKTTVIIHRVKYLLEHYSVSPRHITVVTYTKAAATEMKERFLELQVLEGQHVTFATFHSLFFKILRSVYGYDLGQVVKEEESWSVLKSIIKDYKIEAEDEDEIIQNFFADYTLMKNELKSIREYEPSYTKAAEFQLFVKQYESWKETQQKLDFDDMLTQCYELLKRGGSVVENWRKKLKYILVDEFQDINKAQFECIRLLALPENNLFVVGDDDQSIYSFRGARPEFLLNFPQYYPHCAKVILNINYRSISKIIALSSQVISQNKNRFVKNMKGNRENGHKTVFFLAKDTLKEAEQIVGKIMKLHEEGIPYHEIAIIYRTNIQGIGFAAVLAQRGISYDRKEIGINIYRHFIAKDILAYLSAAISPQDNESVKRILNKPKRYISNELIAYGLRQKGVLLDEIITSPLLKIWQRKKLIAFQQDLRNLRNKKPYEAIKQIREEIGYDEYLTEYATFRHANLQGYFEIADELTQVAKGLETTQEYFAQMNQLDEDIRSPKKTETEKENSVVLSTIHSAKGLEFEAVFVPSLIEGILPHKKGNSFQNVEEERRLFYVAITRAKSRLFLSTVTRRYDKNVTSSRFLKELGLK